MYHTLIIIAFTILGDIYYFYTYTNKLVSDFYKTYVKRAENILVKKSTIKNDLDEEVETNVYINCINDGDTLLSISNSSSSESQNLKYNSAEIITLLWYGNGNLVRNGICFNKDFTVLLALGIIVDLHRDGKFDLCKYDVNDKPLLLCMDKKKTGIPYYDFCIDLFKEKNSIPLHIFVNMVSLHGYNLRNMVIEDLEKKELAHREVKDYFNGKLKFNYWIVRMPLDCQSWFRDYVFKDKKDPSIKVLIDLMILSSNILYQKDRLFSSVFGKNEIFYIKEKFGGNVEIPTIQVIDEDGPSKVDNNKNDN